MSQQEVLIGAGQSFDLKDLFYDQIRSCRGGLRKRGCIKPEVCAFEVVVDYIFGPLRKRSRCFITGDEIEIRFRDAADQKKVLSHHLWLQVKNKKARCRDCSNLTCPLDEVLVDPANSAALHESKERLELILSKIRPELRDAVVAHYINGKTYNELADQLHVAPTTLRQRFSREMKRLSKVLKFLADKPTENVTRSSSQKTQPQKPDTVGHNLNCGAQPPRCITNKGARKE